LGLMSDPLGGLLKDFLANVVQEEYPELDEEYVITSLRELDLVESKRTVVVSDSGSPIRVQTKKPVMPVSLPGRLDDDGWRRLQRSETRSQLHNPRLQATHPPHPLSSSLLQRRKIPHPVPRLMPRLPNASKTSQNAVALKPRFLSHSIFHFLTAPRVPPCSIISKIFTGLDDWKSQCIPCVYSFPRARILFVQRHNLQSVERWPFLGVLQD
jgi:hypothetical protein